MCSLEQSQWGPYSQLAVILRVCLLFLQAQEGCCISRLCVCCCLMKLCLLCQDRILPQGLLSACLWPELSHSQLHEGLENQKTFSWADCYSEKNPDSFSNKERVWLLDRQLMCPSHFITSVLLIQMKWEFEGTKIQGLRPLYSLLSHTSITLFYIK